MPPRLFVNLQNLIILSTLFSSMAFPGMGSSEEINLTASVNKNQLTLEDSIEYSITIHGVKNPSNPELSQLSNFQVRSIGTQSSTQIFNSNMRTSITHKYLLIPKSEGNFVIGPATVKLNGTIYSSNSINVTVKKTAPEKSIENKNAFTKTSVSKFDPFLNEQVVYTFKLFRRLEARNLKLSIPYNESLFRKEDIGKAKRYSKIVNGISYDVEEISMALFPLKIGKATISPSILELDLIYKTQRNYQNDPFSRFFNDPFFGGSSKSQHKILTTQPIDLKILPLPLEDKPIDFKNLVGRFSILAKLGKRQLELGDTTTLTVTVSGTGNIFDITLDDHDLQGEFKVYSDQPTFKQTIHGNQIGGEKTFKFALVPYSTGDKLIPSISFSYFDPDKKKYNTVSSHPVSLKVKPGSKDNQLNLVQPKYKPFQKNEPSVSILARDILPIHTQLKDFESVEFNTIYRIGYVLAIAMPVLIYIFSAGYIRYNHRIKDDRSYSRKQNAFSIAKKKLDGLSLTNTASKDFARELSQIIREYIGNKLNLQGTAFTSIEVEKKLAGTYFEYKKIIVVRKLLEKCESIQYASITIDKNSNLLEESLDLLKELEKQA